MKPFTSLFLLLVIQMLFPYVLFSQLESGGIPAAFDSLIQVSRDYTAATEFAEALTASAAAGEMAIACCGEQSVTYASFCFNEGRIYYFMGRNEEAIPWYLRAKELRSELLGTMHVDYGKSLNNLAVVYEEIGRFSDAEPLYLEVLELREQLAGKESVSYANVLHNLTGLYNDLGDYEKAELHGLQALMLREQLLGKNHVAYATSLVALANVYYQTNNFSRALQFYLEAKIIHERQEELTFYTYVFILDNLGALYHQLSDWELAETYYAEAADLRLQVLGENTEDYALSLNHLAAVFKGTSRYEEAAQALVRSLAILKQLGQQNDNDYAYSLQDLSSVYYLQGEIAKAIPLQEEALRSIEKQFQPHHPRYLRGLRDLANMEQAQGRDSVAAEILRTLSGLEEKPLSSAVRHLSEEELANFTIDFKKNHNRYFALAETYPAIADVCYDNILFYKGFLQNKALQLRQIALADPQVSENYNELRRIHRRLAAKYTSSAAKETDIQQLEAEAYAIEKDLVRGSAAIDDALLRVNWQSVRGHLTPESAALEFVEYQVESPDYEWQERYGALLLLPQSELPIFIPLGSAQILDSLLENENQSTPAFINSLYTLNGSAIYELLWAPVAKHLDGHPEISKVYYSAAGLIHRLNLEALPTPDGKVLAQKYQLLALGSTRQLVSINHEVLKDTRKHTAFLFGGIDYGTAEQLADISAIDQQITDPSIYQPDQYPAHRAYDSEKGYWQSLPWTEVEIMTANDLLAEAAYTAVLKTGKEASEAALKALGHNGDSPELLHLATHGFFFPDPDEVAGENQLAFRASDRSMIRSGLVLADGNYAWAFGQPRQSATEDGILTAYEVSKMDLRETKLVILSACETGLGDIKGTEGVYGLQRAFKIAGARYLIMTLWQVPDFQAQAFMTTFYLAWLEEDKSIPEAFRAAQTYMRARYKEAFDWAGFILIE